MQIQQKPIKDLIPYINNSRTHSDEQVAQIAASIKEFGWTNPILVDGINGIIAGHGRLAAARKLGMDNVPVIELTHLSETQKKALIIADNKLALNSGWDTDLLSLEISQLDSDGFNLEVLGFNAEELNEFMNGVNFDAATEDNQGKLDELDPKWISCPHCGKEFDARQS